MEAIFLLPECAAEERVNPALNDSFSVFFHKVPVPVEWEGMEVRQTPVWGRMEPATADASPAPFWRGIRMGLYWLGAKLPRTSAGLDVDVRRSDVGIEPLVSLAHRRSEALELDGIVCDAERRHSARDGIFSVLAGAYHHQPV
jgi:hypothetical protein